MGEKFTIEDYAEITVKGVEISNKVEPPKSSGYSLIYESDFFIFFIAKIFMARSLLDNK